MLKLFSSAQKVYSRFEKNINGKNIKFKIQDVSKDMLSDSLEFYVKYFFRKEPIVRSTGADKSCMHKQILNVIEKNIQRIGIIQVCCIDSTHDILHNKIVAISTCNILHENDETKFNYEFTTGEVRKLFQVYEYLDESFNVFEKCGVQCYLDDHGMSVHPKYYRLGIGTEMTKARALIQQEGVHLSGGWCTSQEAIDSVLKNGYRSVFEISCAELAAKFQLSFDFPGAPKKIEFFVKEI